MYKYKFVKIKLKSGFVRSKPTEDYQEIITKHAKDKLEICTNSRAWNS